MAGLVIGSVRVKIVPDTRGFREKTEADVLRETANVDADIEVKADTDGVVRDVRQVRERLQRTIKDIKLKVEIARGQARLQAALLSKEIDTILHNRDVWIDVRLKQASLAKAYAQLAAANTLIDLSDIISMPSIQKVGKLVGDSVRDKLQIGMRQAFLGLSGVSAVSRFFQEKWEAVKNFDRIAIKAAQLSTALLTAGGLMGAMAGHTYSALYGLKDLVGVAALLPGVLTAAGAGFYVFKRSLSEFSRFYPGFQKSWDEMESAMSKNFWAQAKTGMNELIEKTFPKFSTGLQGLGTSAGKLFTSFSQAVNANFGPALGNMFKRVSEAFLDLRDSMDPLMSGLSNMIEGSLNAMPLFSLAVRDLSKSFAAWAENANQNGDFQRWAAQGIIAFQQFGSVIKDTIGSLGGIGRALQAGGAATLQDWARNMKAVHAAIDSPAAQEAIARTFGDMNRFAGTFLSSLAPGFKQWIGEFTKGLGQAGDMIAGPLGSAISNLLAGLSSEGAVANFQKGWAGIGDAINSLIPSMELLGEKAGVVFGLIGTLAKNLAPTFNVIFGELAKTIEVLAPSLENVMNTLGPALTSIIKFAAPIVEFLAPFIGQVVEMIAGLISKLVGGLLPVLTELWAVLQPILGAVLPWVIKIAEFIGTVLVNSIIGLVNGVKNVIEGVINVFTGLWNFVAGVFTGNWSQAWEGVKQVFSGVWQAIVGVFQVMIFGRVLGILRGGLAAIKGGWYSGWVWVKNAAVAVWNAIKTGFSQLLAGIVSFLRRSVGLYRNLWSQIFNIFKTGASRAWGAIKTMGSNIISTVTSFGGRMLAAGRDLIGSFINGIKNKAGEAIEAVKGIMGGIAGFFQSSPAKVGPFSGKGFTGARGKQFIKDFATGIGKGSPYAVSAVRGTMEDLGRSFTSMNADFSATATGRFAVGGAQNLALAPAGAGGMVNNYHSTWNVHNQDPNEIAQKFNHEIFRADNGSVHSSRR